MTLVAVAVENLGNVSYAHAATDREEPIVIEVKDDASPRPGMDLTREVLADRAFLFDADGDRL